MCTSRLPEPYDCGCWPKHNALSQRSQKYKVGKYADVLDYVLKKLYQLSQYSSYRMWHIKQAAESLHSFIVTLQLLRYARWVTSKVGAVSVKMEHWKRITLTIHLKRIAEKRDSVSTVSNCLVLKKPKNFHFLYFFIKKESKKVVSCRKDDLSVYECLCDFLHSQTHTQTPNTRNSNTEGLICW